MKIARESWVIATIGLLDLVATILFIKLHGAQEANPLFRHLWAIGPIAFIAVKILFLAGPICVLEWARSYNPRFVAKASRGVIVAYVICYGMGVIRLNTPAHAQEQVALAGRPDPRLMFMKNQSDKALFHHSPAFWQILFANTRARRLTGMAPTLPPIRHTF